MARRGRPADTSSVDRRPVLLPLLILTSAAALAAAAYAIVQQRAAASEQSALRAQVATLRADLHAIGRRVDAVSDRSELTARRLKQQRGNIAVLARRILRSVFTVEADGGFGTGFMAWTDDGASYLVTANHVVERNGNLFVTITRKGGSWSGQIVGMDAKNDLAVIRVSGHPADAPPLWQQPHAAATPQTGQELVLVGSPFGLEGTVTTGVVSRVTKRYIQTDAAANPGNSGGPALDRTGRVAGVLVMGGGQNVNFAIPVAKLCVKLRDC